MSDTKRSEKPIQIAVTSENDNTELFVLTDQGNIYRRMSHGGAALWECIVGPWRQEPGEPPVKVVLGTESDA